MSLKPLFQALGQEQIISPDLGGDKVPARLLESVEDTPVSLPVVEELRKYVH